MTPRATGDGGRPTGGGTGQAIAAAGGRVVRRPTPFVRRPLTAAERGHLARLVRGHRPLRAVRRITDEVYRLFDRRCRTDTALAKVAVLRTRVKRYRRLGRSRDKLRSPTRGTALEFLDDTLLPATSWDVGTRRLVACNWQDTVRANGLVVADILTKFENAGWPATAVRMTGTSTQADRKKSIERFLEESPLEIRPDGTGRGMVWRWKGPQ